MACFVLSCKSHSSRKENNEIFVSFHRMPQNEKDNWCKVIPRVRNYWTKHSRICSRHFTDDCFVSSDKWRRLKPSAIPSLFLDTDDYAENLHPNPGREPLQSMQIDHNASNSNAESQEPSQAHHLSSCHVQNIAENQSSSLHAMEVDENEIPTSSPSCCSASTNKIMKLEQDLEKTKKLCRKRLLKINALRKQTKRLKQKNLTLQDRLQEILIEENLEQDKLLILDAVKTNKVIERYLTKKQGDVDRMYDLELKKFAVTLHYLSPRAYNFVRQELDNVLPHPKTIGKWYQGIDCNPGFTTEAIHALKLRVDANKDKPIFCALSIDEMAIRKILEWDGTNYFGFVNMGCELDSDAVPLAKEALTFMLTSVNDTWKIPVGYFLINSITAHEKATLVQQCLTLLNETGINVVTLTFDGATTNKAMCIDLGCDMSSQLYKFENNGTSICIWPDPCHNIKLVRNTFADKKKLTDIQGRNIDWKYIEFLNKIQNEEGLHLANKLKNEHINFVKQKMKVRLATQLLSNSVADALEYCKMKEIPGFSDCDGTICFIRIFNNLFDVLNSRSMRAKGWKRATTSFNIDEIKVFFESATIYISELKFNETKIIHTNRSTGFIGFIICMKSLLYLYETLIERENSVMTYLCSYKMNQDHIELFFGAIRSMCGFNNNPSAKMFRAAYKKLIVHAEFKESATGNCLPLEEIKILNYSPKKFCKMLNNCTFNGRMLQHEESLLEVNEHDYIYDPSALSEYAKDVANYIAGSVVRSLKKTIICEICLQSLERESKESNYLLIRIKDRGGLITPSSSTAKVCRVTEKVLREHQLKNGIKMLGLPRHMTNMILTVSNLLLPTNVFADLIEHGLENIFTEDHRALLIKTIAQNYLNIRIHYITKNTENDHEKIRSHLTKTVLFKGQ